MAVFSCKNGRWAGKSIFLTNLRRWITNMVGNNCWDADMGCSQIGCSFSGSLLQLWTWPWSSLAFHWMGAASCCCANGLQNSLFAPGTSRWFWHVGVLQKYEVLPRYFEITFTDSSSFSQCKKTAISWGAQFLDRCKERRRELGKAIRGDYSEQTKARRAGLDGFQGVSQ